MPRYGRYLATSDGWLSAGSRKRLLFQNGSFGSHSEICVNLQLVCHRPTAVHASQLSDVAAGCAYAPPMTEGSRIGKVPSLGREKDLL
jgi:hypothetical protein